MSSSSSFVEEAEQWARDLVRDECRFPGDYRPAMKRVAARSRVPYGLIWNLHYRLPKTLDVEKYAALGAFYADEQKRKFMSERSKVRATTALGALLLRAADRLAGEEDGPGKSEENAGR